MTKSSLLTLFVLVLETQWVWCNPNEGRTCKSVCVRDQCVGTWSNALPWGEAWEPHGLGVRYGCCTVGLDRCQICCKPSDGILAPAPEPPLMKSEEPRHNEGVPAQAPEPSEGKLEKAAECRTEVVNATTCQFACAHDKCVGTWSNALPWGEVWEPNGTVTRFGCCTLGLDRCQICCKQTGEVSVQAPSSSCAAPSEHDLQTPESTTIKVLPKETDQRTATTETAQRICKFVCAHDKCIGTWSNVLPWGEVWKPNGTNTRFGCCTAGLDRCQICCNTTESSLVAPSLSSGDDGELKLPDTTKVEVRHSNTAGSDICKFACLHDRCSGTWSNAIPWGEEWEPNGTATSWGCCTLGLDRCQMCCKVAPTSLPSSNTPSKQGLDSPKDLTNETHHSERTNQTSCKYACAYDQCTGTWSNALPWGEVWKPSGATTRWGCCTFGLDRCQMCCKPIL